MTQYVLSLSYGKDSLACLAAIEQLGLPLDRIVHAEVWATDTIPADLPPMVEFKKKADAIIKERWGIEVEHIWATKPREGESASRTCSTSNTITNSTASTLTDSQKSSEVGANDSNTAVKLTYEDIFYRPMRKRKVERERERIYGFPMLKGNWCTSDLKQRALQRSGLSTAPGNSRSKVLRISTLSSSRELVYSPQTEGFPTAPLHKELT